jgi:hypothetical protein
MPSAFALLVILAAAGCASEGVVSVGRASVGPPVDRSFRNAAAASTAPVRWVGPFPDLVRLPEDGAIVDGRLVALSEPDERIRPHFQVVRAAEDFSRHPVGGAWFQSNDAILRLTPAGVQKAHALPARGAFLADGTQGDIDWRGASPYTLYGASDQWLAFLGDCATGDFGSACLRLPSGAWKSIRLHPGLARFRHRFWDFAVIPTGDALYLLERDSEACVARWRIQPGGSCQQRFLLHDAERGILAAYDDVPLWAYHGSNSFMNAHAFHVGRGGVIRMWPVMRDDGELEPKPTHEHCSVDFHPDGTTITACHGGRLAATGAFALWQPPGENALYETLDAGATWRRIRTPAPVTETTDLWCEATGCIIGDRLRLGWGEPK